MDVFLEVNIMDIKNKVVWVTGAASGIGRATAEMFFQKGAKLLGTDIQEELGKEVVAQFGERGLFIKADVTSTEESQKAIAAAKGKWGSIDILINCAGYTRTYPVVTQDGPGPLEPFVKEINIDLIGAYDVARLAGFEMTKNKPNDLGERGAIIQIASMAAITSNSLISGYATAKAGLVHLTDILACAYADYGIRCNCILPGYIRTAITESPEQNPFIDISKDIDFNLFPKKVGEPDVIASACVFMVENTYINKTGLKVDAGFKLRS
ncbi:MAG: 3-oxoacyl-(acyl-carrier-protein) reductase FabG [Pelotomaculum sp. PtaB.Bin104]|nr:MAG: 3-oxoacyl-(acyl-carrier-protein) reductase FabG [Pelotomaculum sp. PtaB.Bin104]